MARSAFLFTLTLLSCLLPGNTCRCQSAVNDSNAHIRAETEWILNPIYGLQSSGLLKLDGTPVAGANGRNTKAGTHFYAVLPGVASNQDFASFDQSSAYYVSYKPKGNRYHTWWGKFLRKHTYIAGITHDKMQTNSGDSPPVKYRFESGGMEFTLMVSRVYYLSNPLDIDFGADRLNLVFNWRAGGFISNNDIGVDYIAADGRTFLSTRDYRVLGDGAGALVSAALDVEVKICDLNRVQQPRRDPHKASRNYYRTLYFSVGNKLLAEAVFSRCPVTVTNPGATTAEPGNHYLTASTYGIFLTPSFNVIFNL